MSQTLIGKRYAKAFFQIASQEKVVETVQHDLALVCELFQESSELQNVLQNGQIPFQQRETILIQSLEKLKISPLSIKFLKFLFFKKRIRLIDAASQAFIEIARAAAGKVQVQIISASPLSQEDLQKLVKIASNYFKKEVEVVNLVDHSIIGGSMIRSGSVVIDGSTKGRLDRIRQSIVKG